MSGTTDIRSLVQGNSLFQPSEWLLDCSFVEESVAALALGALEPDELARVNSHLSWCPTCARLVHETRKTVGYLPFLVPQAAPSAAAKSSLFTRIEAASAIQAASFVSDFTPSVSRSASIPAPLGSESKRSPSAAVVSRSRKRWPRWEFMVAPLAAVPLVMALAIVGVWALRTQDQLDNKVAQARNLQSQNADLSAQVSLLSSGVVNSSTRRFDLDSSDAAVGGSAGGTVVTVANEAWAKLTVWDLPTSTTGYKVLVETKDGQLIPAGQFDVDSLGKGQIELNIELPLDQFQSIHVLRQEQSDRTSTSDSLAHEDVLWLALDSNLGASGGTEANANAH